MSNILPFSKESFIEKSGQYWLDARTIGEALGYEDTSAIFKIYERNQDELAEYSTTVKLSGVDGREREQRVFSEEGIYLISMLARTDKAKMFRKAVAKLLKELRREREQTAILKGAEYQRRLVQMATRSRKETDFFDKLTRYHKAGLTLKETATLLEVSVATVKVYKKLMKPLGYLS